MSYESEKLAATLKAAREKKGLSQRALSAHAGVPQSHISTIESGAVNLTVSSLTAIANALDLELALVPRKAAPAVRTITRSVNDVPKATPEARKEIARLGLNIELRDAQLDPAHKQALLEGGGKVKVPCLKITDDAGQATWLYESDEINRWLHQRFGA